MKRQFQDFMTKNINEETGVSLKMVGILLSGGLGISLWCITLMYGMREDIIQVKNMVRETHRECLGRETFRDWTDDLQRQNPPLKVPPLGKVSDASSSPQGLQGSIQSAYTK